MHVKGHARARQLAALSVMFIAALASLATTQGPVPEPSLEFTVRVPANSFAARQVDVEIAKGDAAIERAALEAAPTYGNGSPSYAAPISIVPVDPSEPMLAVAYRPFEVLQDINQDLSALCKDGCTRSYYILVRNSSVFDREATVALYAFAYGATNTNREPTATVTLSDEQPASAGGSLTGKITGSLDADLFGSGSWHGTIEIPAAANDAVTGRAIGTLLLTGVQAFDGEDAAADAWIAVSGTSRFGARIMRNAADALPAEREWLTSCTPGVACSVPIDLELRWAAPLWAGGHVHLDFTLEARLEYLDRAEPPDGVTLDLVQR